MMCSGMTGCDACCVGCCALLVGTWGSGSRCRLGDGRANRFLRSRGFRGGVAGKALRKRGVPSMLADYRSHMARMRENEAERRDAVTFARVAIVNEMTMLCTVVIGRAEAGQRGPSARFVNVVKSVREDGETQPHALSRGGREGNRAVNAGRSAEAEILRQTQPATALDQ